MGFGLLLLIGLCGCSAHSAPPSITSSSPGRRHLTFLFPQGPVAAAQRTHLFEVVGMLMVVVLPVLLLAPLVAWRYRFGNRSARYSPRWSFSWPLEILIWGVPHLIVIGLAIWLWEETLALDPYKPLSTSDPPLRVEVIGYDWKWLFIYPKFKIASMGEFAFPAGRQVAIALTSDTVMQSFFVPALGSQIYAMANMVTHLHLQADRPGSFCGENTQYNGDGFYRQKFVARGMSAADFAAWTRRVSAQGVVLSPSVYRAIARRSTVDETKKAVGARGMPPGVLYLTGVTPKLFGDVIASFRGGPTDAAGICDCGHAITAAAASAKRRTPVARAD